MRPALLELQHSVGNRAVNTLMDRPRRAVRPAPGPIAVSRVIDPATPSGELVIEIGSNDQGRVVRFLPDSQVFEVRFRDGVRFLLPTDLRIPNPFGEFDPGMLDPGDEPNDNYFGEEDFEGNADGDFDGVETDDDNDDGALLRGQHRRARDQERRVRKTLQARPNKSLEGRDMAAKKTGKQKAKDAGTRFLDQFKPAQAKSSHSKRGTAAKRARQGQALADNPALTPIEGTIDSATQAIVGERRHEGKTRSNASIAEEKVGQGFSTVGNAIGMVPIIGPAGAPFNALGTWLQEHGKGASKKQATATAVTKLGSSALGSAVPLYGTYAGFKGLVTSVTELAMPPERHGDPRYLANLIERRDMLMQLLDEVNTQEWVPNDDRAVQREKLMRAIEKYSRRIDKEKERREQRGRGEADAESRLLDFDDDNYDDDDDF